MLVPGLHRRNLVRGSQLPCSYDLELAAVKYFYSLPDGDVPLSFHFTGMVLLRRRGATACRSRRSRGAARARWRMPVDDWRRVVRAFYPEGGWVRLTTPTLDALLDAQGRARATTTSTRPSRALLAAEGPS